jgi:hypothetical protein
MEITAEVKRRIANHEIGHVIAGIAAGTDIEMVTMDRMMLRARGLEDDVGGCTLAIQVAKPEATVFKNNGFMINDVQELLWFVNGQLIETTAGVVGENFGGFPTIGTEKGDVQNCKALRKDIAWLMAPCALTDEEVKEVAAELIEANRGLFYDLVDQLVAQDTLVAEDIEEAVAKHGFIITEKFKEVRTPTAPVKLFKPAGGVRCAMIPAVRELYNW